MKYRVIATSLLMLGLAGGVSAGVAASAAAPEREADDKAIRQSAQTFKEVFNKGDARAVAALWTPEGEYIDEAGTVFSGRAAIEKEYGGFFKEHPGSKIQITIDSIRFLGPNLAFEEGETRLVEPPPAGASSHSHYTVLHTKQDGNWMMASVKDLESEPLTNYESLKALEPIIGEWTATGTAPSGEKVRAEMTCEWIENRNFIRRRYQTFRGDELVNSGFEIIGVDPEIGEISSWQFNHDGSLGHNVWRRQGDGWAIEARGTTADGRPSGATNILVQVDKDSFKWRSTNRSLAGDKVADTAVATIVRKK